MIVWLRHKCLGLNTVPDESITSLLENKESRNVLVNFDRKKLLP